MKNYTITVNGNVYDVTVEENGNGAAAAPVAAPKAAPKAASKAGPFKRSIEGSSKSSSWSWKHQGRSRCSRKSI